MSKINLDNFTIGGNAPDVLNKHEKLEKEKLIETSMINGGINRFYKGIVKAKSTTSEATGKEREPTEATTVYGQQLLCEALDPVNDAINTYFQNAFSGKAGRFSCEAEILAKCISITEIAKVKSDKWYPISYIALKAILDCITLKATQTKVINKIGNAVEDEARLFHFKDVNTKAYTKTKEYLKSARKNNYRHKRKIYFYAMDKNDLEFKGWPKENKIRIGKLLLEIIVKTTGLVKTVIKQEGKNNSPIYVEATQKTLDWISKKKIHSEILKPLRHPMIISPKEWINPYSGGYYIKELRPETLSATIGILAEQTEQKAHQERVAETIKHNKIGI